MSEELAFREARAERSAIQRHEGPSAPLRVETVNRARVSFLAGAGLAADENGKVAKGTDLENPSTERQHCRALAHDAEPRHRFTEMLFLLSSPFVLPDRDEEAPAELCLEIRPTAVEHFVHAREQRPTLQPQRRTVPFVGVRQHSAAAVAQLSHDRELRVVVSAESDEGDAFR